MGFLTIPWPLEGWHRLKLALNDLFISMKWLLTCFDCISSFLFHLCANRRLYIGSIYRHGHGQACSGIKLRNFTKFFHRLKMVQFAKLTCLNRQIPIFWKFSHLQDVLSPDLVIFSQKISKIENFFQWSKMVQFAKLTCLNCQIHIFWKIFPSTGCLQLRLRHFLKKKVNISLAENDSMRIVIMKA